MSWCLKRTDKSLEIFKKTEKLTFVDFAREKEKTFDQWCTAIKAHEREQLWEIILLEEFQNCIPDAVAM